MSYLRIQDYHSLRRMRFTPRNRIHGQYLGLHDSPQQGQNVEFREYREYNPGDDAGGIDWKVYGRSNRLVVKHFEHQTNLDATLIVDGSSSMAFRGWRPQRIKKTAASSSRSPGPPPLPEASKFDLACQLACAIAFLLVQQKDRVGFALAREGLNHSLPCRGDHKQLHRMEHLMEPPGQQEAAALASCLRSLRKRAPHRGTLIVFSDFMEDEEEVFQQLRWFRARGDDVLLFQVLHAEERRIPDLGGVLLVDSETGQTCPMQGADRRASYEANLNAYLSFLRKRSREEGFSYSLVDTGEPYFLALKNYLHERSRIR